MNNDNYITILGWMINELGLSGNELFCYAVIYGFSQDGKSEFTGSLSWLSETLKIDKSSVRRILKKLVDKNYISRTDIVINGVMHPKYKNALDVSKIKEGVAKCTQGVGKISTGCVQNEQGGMCKISTNNTNNILIEDITKDIDSIPAILSNCDTPAPAVDVVDSGRLTADKFVDMFNTYTQSFPKVKILSKSRRAKTNSRVKEIRDEGTAMAIFSKMEESPFLRGDNGKWKASFDWLVTNSDNWVKILEGNYDEVKEKSSIEKSIEFLRSMGVNSKEDVAF